MKRSTPDTPPSAQEVARAKVASHEERCLSAYAAVVASLGEAAAIAVMVRAMKHRPVIGQGAHCVHLMIREAQKPMFFP